MPPGRMLVVGIMFKEIVEYAVRFGAKIAADCVSNTDRMFHAATRTLSNETLRSMDDANHKKLEWVVMAHGFRLTILRELFRKDLNRNH